MPRLFATSNMLDELRVFKKKSADEAVYEICKKKGITPKIYGALYVNPATYDPNNYSAATLIYGYTLDEVPQTYEGKNLLKSIFIDSDSSSSIGNFVRTSNIIINEAKVIDYIKPKVCSYMFYKNASYSNIPPYGELDLRLLDTSECSNMTYMFYNCSVRNIIAYPFDVSNVTSFSYMFSGCSNLKQFDQLRTWKVINGTGFDEMFYGAHSLNIDLSFWDCRMASSWYRFNVGAPGVIPPERFR